MDEAERKTQPTAAEIAGLVAAERLAIRMGWLDRCDYIGLGRCVRATEHDLPHVTDPNPRKTDAR
jgi:hypothetical protein